jgi:CubicO group peptidase (beta-lactamase class C family)
MTTTDRSTPPTTLTVHGWCAPAFEPLAAVLARTVAENPQGGAAVCVHHDGAPVVDLHAGATYRSDSRQLVFSVAKAVSAVAAHVAARRGELDLDQPLGEFWPAFDRPATAAITCRTVLAHRAGLPAVDQPLTLVQIAGGELERALEQQEPYWEPGTAHGYHTITFGTLLDGIFTRALGVTVGEYARRHLVEPLGLHLSYGVPTIDGDVLPVLSRGSVAAELPDTGTGSSGLLEEAGFGLLDDPTIFNHPPMSAVPFPAVGVVARARDLARLMAATCGDVDGTRLLDAVALDGMRATHSAGRDRVSTEISHFGAGVMLPSPRIPFLGPGSFGHDGHGGALVACLPETATTFAFTTDVLPRIGGASTGALASLATLRHCLDHLD